MAKLGAGSGVPWPGGAPGKGPYLHARTNENSPVFALMLAPTANTKLALHTRTIPSAPTMSDDKDVALV